MRGTDGLVCCLVSISDALSSLLSSSELISSLPFRRTQVFSTAVLAPEDWFEHALLRDSEPHENALFVNPDNKFDPAEEGADLGGDKWVAAKRKGPKRAAGQGEVASPLRERGVKGQDSGRCLGAAEKLLEV